MKDMEQRVAIHMKASISHLTKMAASALAVVCTMTASTQALPANGGYPAPYMQADNIQNITEWSAAMINPALLWRVNQMRFEFGAYRWGWDADKQSSAMGYQQISLLVPVRTKVTVGATLLNSGSSFQQSTVENDQIIENGADWYGEWWVVGHASYRPLPFLSIGANPKMFTQSQNSFQGLKAKQGVGGGLDVGTYLNAFDNYRFGDLGFSLMLQDIIPPTVAWEGDSGQTIAAAQAGRMRIGFRYTAGGPLYERLVVAVDGVVDGAFQGIGDAFAKMKSSDNATSAVDNAKSAFRLSLHAKFQWLPMLWLKAGWNNNRMPYVGFNFNTIYPLPERINYLNIDGNLGYSFADLVSQESKRGLTGMFKVSTDFGATREQRESKRMYDQLVMAPMNDYNEAMRLYTAGKWWDASFAFGKVLALYPNFHLNDNVTYYMGDCYSHQYLNTIARQVFKDGLSEFPTSGARAKFLYGLEQLDYREGKFEDALKNHAFIVNLYPESDVRADADYLAGQIQFQRKNYNAAIQLLSSVKRGTNPYLYAQYTLAVVNIENGKNQAAVLNLQNVVGDSTVQKAEVMLRAAADNKLGQLHFEQVELKEAVEAFKRVPEASPYYDQALLGIGWAWIKANRPQECLVAINQLISVSVGSAMIPEAYLLKGYAQLLTGDAVGASASLQKSIDLCRETFPDDAMLVTAKSALVQGQTQFEPTAQLMLKNALRKPSPRVEEERVVFKSSFETFDQSVSSYFNVLQDVEKSRDFFRRKDQVVTDAEYALAKASKSLGQKKEQDILQKGVEKTQKIDTELDRLQKELEELDGK